MRRIPRLLATILILALLNVSYINIALATAAPSPGDPAVSPAATSDPKSTPEPQGPPGHATKDDIKKDIDDTISDYNALIGTDPEGFAKKFVTDTGLDPIEDLEESKSQVDGLSDDDFDKHQAQFDKAHNKFQKRKKNMAALLNNKPLMAMLHAPSPLKYRVIIGNTGIPGAGTQQPVFGVKPGVAAPSKTSSLSSGSFSKNLGNMTVTVVPEYTKDCNPGAGIPGGIGDLYISKGVSLAAEIVKEFIPDDTTMVIPMNIAVGVWSAAKIAEMVLDALHGVYIECKAKQDGDEIQNGVKDTITILNGLSPTITDISTDVDSINTTSGDIKTTLNSTNTTVNDIKTTVNGINSHTDTVKGEIITELGKQGDATTTAVNTSTTTITSSFSTALTNAETNITNNITNNKNLIVNNDNTNATNIVNNSNANAANIINNANGNTLALTSLALRLMIEADLAAPDASVPIALFETPAAKGGHLELVRSIVAATIANLAGAKAAQANSALNAGDSYKAAGNFKAAYAQYRKAYKVAAT